MLINRFYLGHPEVQIEGSDITFYLCKDFSKAKGTVRV